MNIQMGNDEFILYIRKNYPSCKISNQQLGRKIWVWIRDNDSSATQLAQDIPCYWGDEGIFIDEIKLPKSATQFSFERTLLPQLYGFLDTLGINPASNNQTAHPRP